MRAASLVSTVLAMSAVEWWLHGSTARVQGVQAAALRRRRVAGLERDAAAGSQLAPAD